MSLTMSFGVQIPDFFGISTFLKFCKAWQVRWHVSGQISSRVPHTGPDFPQKVAFWKGNPRLFQGNLYRLVKYYNLARCMYLGCVELVIFYGFYHGINHHFAPPFGRICLELFPDILSKSELSLYWFIYIYIIYIYMYISTGAEVLPSTGRKVQFHVFTPLNCWPFEWKNSAHKKMPIGRMAILRPLFQPLSFVLSSGKVKEWVVEPRSPLNGG